MPSIWTHAVWQACICYSNWYKTGFARAFSDFAPSLSVTLCQARCAGVAPACCRLGRVCPCLHRAACVVVFAYAGFIPVLVACALDCDLRNSLNMVVMFLGKRASATQIGIKPACWGAGAIAIRDSAAAWLAPAQRRSRAPTVPRPPIPRRNELFQTWGSKTAFEYFFITPTVCNL